MSEMLMAVCMGDKVTSRGTDFAHFDRRGWG